MKKMSTKYIISIGILFYSFGYGVIAFSNNMILLIVAMSIATIGEIIYVPQKQAILAEIIPNEQRGSYLAVYDLTFKSASMLGALSVTIGEYLSSFVMGLTFFLAGVISIILFLIAIHKFNHYQQSIRMY